MQRSVFVRNGLLLVFVLFTALHVAAQIVWLTKPYNTPVKVGQDLVLHCRVQTQTASSRSLSVSWQFSNSSAVPARAMLMANHSLFLPKVRRDDEGNYTCQVTLLDDEGQVLDVQKESALVVIAYIRDFILHPQNTSAAIGSDAVLTCVTGRSVPYPSVHWEMNGVRMENAHTLMATYGEFDTTGLSEQISMKLMYRVLDEEPRSFRCVATNMLSGETIKSLSATVTALRIDVAPQIVSTPPSQVIVMENQPLTLDCQVSGYPEPAVFWYKDGSYANDERIFMLSSVTAENAGVYSCVASNRVNKTQSENITVTVASLGLKFQQEPSNSSALAGNPVTLQCTPPPSVPPASVTWYKDHAPFVERSGVFAATVTSESDQTSLRFSSVQEKDEGEYYCVATNIYFVPSSRTSATAHLTVHGAPVFTEPPMDTQVNKGTLLHLKCGVDLATVQSVVWTFEGEMVRTSGTVAIMNRGQDLWINEVGKDWEGQYTCTASNTYGQKSVSAVVTVIVAPATMQSLGNVTVSVGYAVRLPCYIYGDPQPTFVWYHNGSLIADTDRHRVLPSGLFFESVTVDDRGNYSCMGNNSGGMAWSNGSLEVTVPPTAEVEEAEVTAVVGEPLYLKCHVQGHPPPAVSWLLNGTSIMAEDVLYYSDNTSLIIPVFTWSRSGQFTCRAENVDGTAVATVNVNSQVKPRVVQITGKTSVDVGRSLKLTCDMEGVPPPRVSWLHDGQEMQATLDGRIVFVLPATLLVKFATKQDQGQYQCVATSVAGSDRSHVDVVIVEPPRPPKLLEATAQSASSVLLRWQHVFQPPSTDVTAFSVYYWKRVSGQPIEYYRKFSPLITEAEIEGLEAGLEYVFSVSAENSAGQGLTSNNMTALTFLSGPSEPSNFRVVSTTATTATVSWEIPKDTSSTSSSIKRYQLQYRKLRETDYSLFRVSGGLSLTQIVVLESLIPFTAYEVRVRAAILWQGKILWGNFSSTLSLTTNMTVPSAPPSNLTSKVLDPFSMLVTWQPVPASQQNGPITGYRVTYTRNQMTAPDGIITRNSSWLSVTLAGLSPWTWYTVKVAALNPVGSGPQGQVKATRTDPTIPDAPPQGLTVSPLPGSRVRVLWQTVADQRRNSDLSAYVVLYRLAGSAEWTEIVTADNQTMMVIISGLKPWSWYEVKVAAETTLVSPGRGPFSASVEIHTLQTAAGPVRKVAFNITMTTVALSWAPPAVYNGELNGYRVDYHTIPPADREDGIAVVNTTQVQLSNLHPDVVYNISIAALNAAGRGNAIILRLRTDPRPATPGTAADATEVEAETAETDLELSTAANQTSSAQRKLPVIVAGTLTGAAILIIILLVVLCRWFRFRRETRAKYLITDGHLQGYGSGSLYRQMDNNSDITGSQRSLSPAPTAPLSSSSSSIVSSQQHQQQQFAEEPQGSSRTGPSQPLGDSSWLVRQAQIVDGRAKGPPTFLPVGRSSEVKGHAALTHSASGGDVYSVQDLEVSFDDSVDNFGFNDEKILLPGLPPSSTNSPEGATPTSDAPAKEGAEKKTSTLNRRRGRMRSESAAAIAVLRSANSATLGMDDTQFLLSNQFANVETEVVFKHRTVL